MIEKICPSCKRSFNTDRETQVYCNQECYSKSEKLKLDSKNSSLIKNNTDNKWHLGHTKEDVSYKALHDWVRYHKEKTGKCAICGRKDSGIEGRDFDLANISGEYKRDLSDYEWLCVWCHDTFDRFVRKGIYIVIGVESKKAKYLDAKERRISKWYLEHNTFSKMYVAYPLKNKLSDKRRKGITYYKLEVDKLK